MLRSLCSWAGWWLGFFPLYLLLAGSLSGQEIVAGLIVAGLAALAMMVTRRAGRLHFQPRLRWFYRFRHLPGRVLADCVIVAVALARMLLCRQKIEGVFRTIPFDAGGEDAESAARRALAIAAACLAPNSYIVAIDAEGKQLLLHQLVPSAQPPGQGDREWPI